LQLVTGNLYSALALLRLLNKENKWVS